MIARTEDCEMDCDEVIDIDLPGRYRRLLEEVRRFVAARGRPPTDAELAERCRLKRGTVQIYRSRLRRIDPRLWPWEGPPSVRGEGPDRTPGPAAGLPDLAAVAADLEARRAVLDLLRGFEPAVAARVAGWAAGLFGGQTS